MKLSRVILTVLLVMTMFMTAACNTTPPEDTDTNSSETEAPETNPSETEVPETEPVETEAPETEHAEANETVHEIKTADDLLAIAKAINEDWETFDGHTYLLMNDIDMAGIDWTPIGYGNPFTFDIFEPGIQYFSGTFDGQGHVIKNLEIDVTGTGPNGFFGLTCNATIINLGVETSWNVTTTEVSHGSGNIVGWSYNTTIENCYAKSTGLTEGSELARLQELGGIVGFASGGSSTTVKNSYFAGVHGGDMADYTVGGIVGYSSPYNPTVVVENCYSVGVVSSEKAPSDNFGGIVSCTESNADTNYSCTITNCYTTATQIFGTRYVGDGLVIENSEANLTEADIIAEKLGDAFVVDTGINNDLPILAWEVK